jgi:hypothetical protein
MKYIKNFEKLLHTIKYSNTDKIIDRIKNKFGYELEKEFSKYLTPTNIDNINNKKPQTTKAFLLKDNYGVKFNIKFETHPYRTVANICVIYKVNDKWRSGKYIQYSNRNNIPIDEFVSKYIDELKIKYERREKRLFKKDVNKYNL